jgi:small subunit ribosomal protein S20
MPIKQAAAKALRQTKKKTLINQSIKNNVDFLIRKARKLIKAKKLDEAKVIVRNTIKALDKAAQKKVLKKNTAARTKSRLMKALNVLMKK